jgi:hypothetical protein
MNVRPGMASSVFMFVDQKMALDDGYEWARSQSRRVSHLLSEKITC